MATTLGSVALGSYARYELRYDLLGQNQSENYSSVRLYGVLVVTGNNISWSRGSASVHTSGLQSIGTSYGRGEHTVITRDFNFGHDNNGNFSAYIGASISTTYLSGDTGGTLSLPQIKRFATITNSPSSFTDEDNPWIDFSNPANSSMSVWLEPNPGGPHLAIRNIGGTGGRYTWNLTDDERNQLRSSCKNANSCVIRLGLYSTIGGSTSASYHDRTYKIINANPEFNDFTFKDINPYTIALTGDDQVNINGYSNIKVTIPVENKAIAKKSATMNKYRLSIGNNTTDILYSDTKDVSGTINSATSGTYNLYATDSRNNSTLVTKLAKKVIDYTKININSVNASATRNNNGVGKQCIVSFDGTFWNGDFGTVTNHLENITYRFKKTTDSTWITGTSAITVTVDKNEFSFSGKLKSNNENPDEWDLESAYNIEITISDTLSSSVLNLILNSGVPTIALAKNGVGIMGKYDESAGGLLQVGGVPISEGLTYSTEEQRIGTWFGKPLYRKYLNFNLATSTIYNSISHNISDIDDIFKIEGRVYDGTEFYIIPASLPTDNTPKYGVAIQSITKSKIYIYTGTENKTRNMNCKMFIYYTKTTD